MPRKNNNAPDAQPEAQEQQPELHTVRMQRGDKFADVHPDEVANWTPHGWRTVEAE